MTRSSISREAPPDKPQVPENGTIRECGQPAISRKSSPAPTMSSPISNDMTNKVDALLDKINRGEGTLGTVSERYGPCIDKLNHSRRCKLDNLVADVRTGNGTVGKLMSDDELYRSVKVSVDRLDGTIAKLDTMIDKVNNGPGTIGKFMNDPSLYNKARTADRPNSVRVMDNIDRGEGNDRKTFQGRSAL